MNNNKQNTPREHLGSRLGFILLSAGCAIGIGNVWKFPYMAGQHGGAIFVLFYFAFLLLMGIPVLTMEFALGRAAQKSPARLYQELAPKGSKWYLHGYAAVAGNYILMMFYTTVAGWMLRYFVSTAKGDLAGLDAAGVGDYFGGMLSDPVSMTIYMGIVVVVGFLVCSFSLQKGLEKITKIMMTSLLVIMVVLAVNGFFMDGAAEGLKFYLLPDLEQANAVGWGNIIMGALTQSFFTLSLGIGSMAIFGSYLNKDRALFGEAINVAVLDTFVAITSGLIIFPACFSYGVQVDSGPNLIFVTLPNIFNDLPLGRFWGSLFFVFLSFAALSTVFAVFENIISCTRDMFGWSKRKACLINGVAMFLLSLPCVLGFNLLSGITPFGEGSGIMDLEDFMVSNLLLPLGSLVFAVFCVCRYGWGWKKFVAEANQGKGLKIANWMRPYMTYVLPVIIFVFFVISLIGFFA
ncbi:MAG: sodium-dependent transporter [Ruminococcaceae bacterium]|nr:sodium-dependent transporter [Oscillospiraceae bacterium]